MVFQLGNRHILKLSGTIDVAELLLSYGADPNFVSKATNPDPIADGYSYTENYTQFPLMTATCRNAPSLVKLLLKAGANVNQKNSVGQTVLHGNFIYSFWGYPNSDVTHTLLSHQADVHLQDAYGRTALHYACQSANLDAIEILLEAGARFNIVDGSGLTELQLAAQSDIDPDLKVNRLLELYPYPKQAIIETYETLAWSLAEKYSENDCLDTVTDYMSKATLMRKENNIPKTVSDPLECYGFVSEWVTMEDLAIHQKSHEQLQIQAMLATERIHRGRHTLWQLVDYLHFHSKYVGWRSIFPIFQIFGMQSKL